MFELTDESDEVLRELYCKLDEGSGDIAVEQDDPKMKRYEELLRAEMIEAIGGWGSPVILILSITPKGVEHMSKVRSVSEATSDESLEGSLADEVTDEALGVLIGLSKGWNAACGGKRLIVVGAEDENMEQYRELSRAGMIECGFADDVVWTINFITSKGRRCINEVERKMKEDSKEQRWEIVNMLASAAGAFFGSYIKNISN